MKSYILALIVALSMAVAVECFWLPIAHCHTHKDCAEDECCVGFWGTRCQKRPTEGQICTKYQEVNYLFCHCQEGLQCGPTTNETVVNPRCMKPDVPTITEEITAPTTKDEVTAPTTKDEVTVTTTDEVTVTATAKEETVPTTTEVVTEVTDEESSEESSEETTETTE